MSLLGACLQKLEPRPYHRIGRWGRGRVRAVDLDAARSRLLASAVHLRRAVDRHAAARWSRRPRRSRATTDRMFLLKNPPNDYVAQPEGQQFAQERQPHEPRLRDHARRARRAWSTALASATTELVLWRKLQTNFKPQHFDHDAATGYVLASMALGARDANLRFISAPEILSRPNARTRRAMPKIRSRSPA